MIFNKLFLGLHNQRSERNLSIISDKFFLAFFYTLEATGVTLARFQSHGNFPLLRYKSFEFFFPKTEYMMFSKKLSFCLLIL